jgi:hypothetical protein
LATEINRFWGAVSPALTPSNFLFKAKFSGGKREGTNPYTILLFLDASAKFMPLWKVLKLINKINNYQGRYVKYAEHDVNFFYGL